MTDSSNALTVNKTGDNEIDEVLKKLSDLVEKKGGKITATDGEGKPQHFFGLATDCCN
jgi:hypothetical protein